MDDSLVRCRRARPGLRTGDLDWAWARSWLEQQRPISTFDPVPAGFRLIDVQSKSVVLAPPFSSLFKYACLSYVWGNTASYQTTRENIHLHAKDGSLAHENVPATIRDAMTACHYLGIGYLWVDRLCIVQDDDDADGEKQIQINNMGRIYNHASVVLAAVEGKDAESGLRGVSKSLPRTTNGMFYFKDQAVIMESKWANRGWTYQEAILSRRLMMFTSHDVFFERERDILKRKITKAWPGHWFHGSLTYPEVVSNYTKRALTNPNDILNAFHGICGHLFEENHRFGLPLNSFHTAVIWLPVDNGNDRRFSQGNHIFPSWSWTSVKGQIGIYPTSEFGDNWGSSAFPTSSWIFIDQIDIDGNASMSFPRPPDPGRWTHMVSLAGPACRSGCMPTVPRTLLGYEPGSRDENNHLWCGWRSHKEFWEHCQDFDEKGVPAYAAGIPIEQKRLAAKPGRVLVFAQAAILPITASNGWEAHCPKCRPSSESCTGGNRCGVYIGGKIAGIISFDLEGHGQEVLSKSNQIQLVSILASKHEILGLEPQFSEGNAGEKILHCLRREFHKWDEDEDMIDVFCVMAVETLQKGGGVSRRIGLGFVDFSEWLKLEAEKSFFVLE
ncbi:heterokaryon incompatibility protein-domain-containing protein [Phyllosticta citricarpa]